MFGGTHNPDGSPKDPDGQQLGPDDSIEGANGARPRRNIPGDPYNFTGARASVGASLQQQEALNADLADDLKQLGKHNTVRLIIKMALL